MTYWITTQEYHKLVLGLTNKILFPDLKIEPYHNIDTGNAGRYLPTDKLIQVSNKHAGKDLILMHELGHYLLYEKFWLPPIIEGIHAEYLCDFFSYYYFSRDYKYSDITASEYCIKVKNKYENIYYTKLKRETAQLFLIREAIRIKKILLI